MGTLPRARPGQFIWHDLAAVDTTVAIDFYRNVFGWTAVTEQANGGQFIRLISAGEDVASMFQLSQRHRAHAVPSHWTPYVCVKGIEAAVQRAEIASGVVLVRPFEVDGVARIALIRDSVGSTFGMWESLADE